MPQNHHIINIIFTINNSILYTDDLKAEKCHLIVQREQSRNKLQSKVKRGKKTSQRMKCIIYMLIWTRLFDRLVQIKIMHYNLRKSGN